jgi:type IV pilus assembly protein PilV
MSITTKMGRQNGMLMIEVLITILIVSIGLLGIGATFARSQLVSDEAYQRNQAVSIAHQLSEQLSTNRTEAAKAQTSAYVTGVSGALIAGDSGFVRAASCTACTTAQMAANDLTSFHDAIVGAQKTQGATKVSALIGALGCVEYLGPALGAPVDVTNPPRYRISVVWQGRQASAETVNATLCGSGLYGAGLRRVISIEVQVL